MNKKKKLIIIGIVLIVGIILLFGLLLPNKKNNNVDGRKLKNNYEKLNGKTSEDGKKYVSVDVESNNIIKYVSIDKVLDILSNKSGVIYIGSSKSAYSRSAINILIEASNDSNIDKVYYYDIDNICDIKNLDQKTGIIKDCEDNDKVKQLYEKLDNIYKGYTLESNILILPTVLFVSNGEIVSSNIKTIPTHKNPYSKLVKSQEEGLKEIYMSGLDDIINNKNLAN